jgi:hypothetical protein
MLKLQINLKDMIVMGILFLINFHVIHQTWMFSPCFHPIKNVSRGKNGLLLCHLLKVIKIACYSCQILKLLLIIVF